MCSGVWGSKFLQPVSDNDALGFPPGVAGSVQSFSDTDCAFLWRQGFFSLYIKVFIINVSVGFPQFMRGMTSSGSITFTSVM